MKTHLILLSLFVFASNAQAGVSGACLAKMQDAVSTWEKAYNGANDNCKIFLDTKEADKESSPNRKYCLFSKGTLEAAKKNSAAACDQCASEPGVSQACAQGQNGLSSFLGAAKQLR